MNVIWYRLRNGLQGDAGDGTPAQMPVHGADAIDARLRSDCEIGSSCDRARQNDRTVAVVDDGPFGSFQAGVTNATTTATRYAAS